MAAKPFTPDNIIIQAVPYQVTLYDYNVYCPSCDRLIGTANRKDNAHKLKNKHYNEYHNNDVNISVILSEMEEFE